MTFQVTPYHQAYRRMILSWSEGQMMGSSVTNKELEDRCYPDITNKQMEVTRSQTGVRLNPDDFARPCGLLAKYFPKDDFMFKTDKGTLIIPTQESISWNHLKGTKFRSVDLSKEWTDIENERFINWMRPTTFQHMTKVWGRFERDIPAGPSLVLIDNMMDVENFDGAKYFGIEVGGWFGGRNMYMPVVMGVLTLCSLVFTFVFFITKRAEQDIDSEPL